MLEVGEPSVQRYVIGAHRRYLEGRWVEICKREIYVGKRGDVEVFWIAAIARSGRTPALIVPNGSLPDSTVCRARGYTSWATRSIALLTRPITSVGAKVLSPSSVFNVQLLQRSITQGETYLCCTTEAKVRALGVVSISLRNSVAPRLTQTLSGQLLLSASAYCPHSAFASQLLKQLSTPQWSGLYPQRPPFTRSLILASKHCFEDTYIAAAGAVNTWLSGRASPYG